MQEAHRPPRSKCSNGEGVPIQSWPGWWGTFPWPGLDGGGYPPPPWLDGYPTIPAPLPRPGMGYPPPFRPGQGKVPHPVMVGGGYSGYLSSRPGKGYPLPRPGMGYLLPHPDLWWGTPPRPELDGVPPSRPVMGYPSPPPESWTDTHLWKHNLLSYVLRTRAVNIHNRRYRHKLQRKKKEIWPDFCLQIKASN